MRPLIACATCYFILLQTQAFSILDRILYGEWDGKGGDHLTQALNLLSWAMCFLLIYLGRQNLTMIRSRLTYWLLLCLFVLASTAWSVVPELSFREAILFTFLVFAASGVATSISVDRFMAILGTAAAVCGLLSLVLRVVAPGQVGGEIDDFRGLFPQKNVFGQAMAIGGLGTLHCLRAGIGSRWRHLASLAILGACVVLSKSTTSTMTLVTTCGIDFLASSYRRGGAARLFAIAAAVVATPVVVTALVAPDALFELIGKDPTLTGRTEIWDFVWRMIQDRPVVGWGFLAFFSTANPHAIELDDIVQWVVPQSHNGLLEILLHLGFVGASLYAGLIVVTLRCSFRCLREGQVAVGMSTLLSTITVLEVGVSEMVLLAPVQILTALFVVLSLASERSLREARARRASPVPRRWMAASSMVQA